MTEDEAKQRWCPFTRLITTEDKSVAMRSDAPAGWNRYSGDRGQLNNSSLCIGSACMAWRPEHETLTKLGGEEWSRPKDGHGFCGLAGPQP